MKLRWVVLMAAVLAVVGAAYASPRSFDAVSLGMGGVSLSTPNGPWAAPTAPLGFWDSRATGFGFAREASYVQEGVRAAVESDARDEYPDRVFAVTAGYVSDSVSESHGVLGVTMLQLSSATQFGLLFDTQGGGDNLFAASFAKPIGDSDFRAGLSVVHSKIGEGATAASPSVGWQTETGDGRPLRLVLQWRDITNKIDSGLDFGAAWQATDRLLVAADVLDLAGEDDVLFNAGAEYALGSDGDWAVRAGAWDRGDGHDLTLGAGCRIADNWRVDVGWANTEPDSMWEAAVGTTF